MKIIKFTNQNGDEVCINSAFIVKYEQKKAFNDTDFCIVITLSNGEYIYSPTIDKKRAKEIMDYIQTI